MKLTANKSKTSAAQTRSGAGQQNSWHREDYRTECEKCEIVDVQAMVRQATGQKA